MAGDDLKLSKKCFVKCGKGHRAFKVPGEKKTFYCSECELKITSEDTPKYTSQYEGKKKKGPKKKPGPKKQSGISEPEVAAIATMVGKIKLVAASNCASCFHKDVCYVVKANPKAKLALVQCSQFYRILS